MMNTIQKIIGVTLILSFFATLTAEAQQRVTLRDLNSYEAGTLNSVNDIPNHPLVGELVQFTGVILSYPRNSGLANIIAGSDPVQIGRIHVFVVDTSAYSQGLDGMYMQIVQASNLETFEVFEGLERGDIIDVTGSLTFFGNTAQMTVQVVEFVGSTDAEPFTKYADLLEPITVDMTEVNRLTEAGYEMVLENYTKFANRYVRFNQATVINNFIADTGRPWFYIRQGEGNIYSTDTSLRFRNDRTAAGYRDGYNWRRPEDGPFRPPAPGAVVEASGFLVVNTFDPDGIDGPETTFNLALWDDGVVWRGSGDDAVRETPATWPNDLQILGFPPSFGNYTISDTQPGSSEQVTVNVRVLPADEGDVITDVSIRYTATNLEEPVTVPMEVVNASTRDYSFTFPTFPEFTAVEFIIQASTTVDVDGTPLDITGTLRDGDTDDQDEVVALRFFVLDGAIDNIAVINRTPGNVRDASPLASVEAAFPMNIEAYVVSGVEDGFIVIHDSNEQWSGIFLVNNEVTADLRRGDRIRITSATVGSSFTNNFLTLTDGDLEVLSSGNNVSAVVPVITPSDVVRTTNRGAGYNGMLVRLNDVYAFTSQADAPASDFGEWAIAAQGDTEDVAWLRIRGNLAVNPINPTTNIPAGFNAHVKEGNEFDAVYGVLSFSFSNPKLALRSIADIVPVEGGDITFPVRNINLFEPGPGATVIVNGDVRADWENSRDFDGDDVSYIFAVFATSDSAFENPLFTQDTDTNFVSISFDALDAFLSDAGLSVGETITAQWTVWLTDGRDTVQVSTKSGPNFTPVGRVVTFQRAALVSADNDEMPEQFTLAQNFPNPFNPTTQIQYSLPQAAMVQITVYDVLGRRVATLVNEEMTAGAHIVNFDASRLASGMYMYRMQAGDFVQTRKMMLLK